MDDINNLKDELLPIGHCLRASVKARHGQKVVQEEELKRPLPPQPELVIEDLRREQPCKHGGSPAKEKGWLWREAEGQHPSPLFREDRAPICRVLEPRVQIRIGVPIAPIDNHRTMIEGEESRHLPKGPWEEQVIRIDPRYDLAVCRVDPLIDGFVLPPVLLTDEFELSARLLAVFAEDVNRPVC